jgi:hypothetical protein
MYGDKVEEVVVQHRQDGTYDYFKMSGYHQEPNEYYAKDHTPVRTITSNLISKTPLAEPEMSDNNSLVNIRTVTPNSPEGRSRG